MGLFPVSDGADFNTNFKNFFFHLLRNMSAKFCHPLDVQFFGIAAQQHGLMRRKCWSYPLAPALIPPPTSL